MHRILLCLCLFVCVSIPTIAVEPPEQPLFGPGGSDYAHDGVRVTRHWLGRVRYNLYEPSGPTPESAPVLLFLSGIGRAGPYLGAVEFNVFAAAYGPMFRHLARKGYVVIFPAYGVAGTPLNRFDRNAARSARRALDRLSGRFHVSPEPGQFAVAGHSFGGLTALKIANDPGEYGLPQPLAVIGQEPALISQIRDACAGDSGHALCAIDTPESLDGIPPGTVHVTIVGGQARMAEMANTLEQWDLPQIPAANKSLLFINDDERGAPGLRATHLSNGAHPSLQFPGFELDAIDWYGYWKPTEAALDYAFRGASWGYVMGDGADARFMGVWSDGTPVAPMSTASDFMGE